MRALGPCFALGLFIAVPREARASNEDDFFPGNRAAMTAGAVTATVADGSATYFNPAGLAGSTGTRIDVSASAYMLRLYNVPGFLRTANGARQDASVTELLTIPTEVAYVRRLGERVALGLGYFVPRSGDRLLQARVSDSQGNATTSSVLDSRSTETSFLLAAGLGWQATPRVRLGASACGGYESTTSTTTFFTSRSLDGAATNFVQLSQLQTFTRLSAHMRFGVQVDLGSGFTLGAAIRGPRVQVSEGGSESTQLSYGAKGADGTSQFGADTSETKDHRASFGLLEWGRYHLGLSYEYGATALSAEVDVQPGLTNTRLDVERNLAVNVRAGVYHAVTDRLTLGGGFFTDRRATPDTSDLNFQGVTAGLELRDLLRLAIGERAKAMTLTTVFAGRYAHGAGPSPTITSNADSLITSSAVATERVHEIGIHVGSSLRY